MVTRYTSFAQRAEVMAAVTHILLHGRASSQVGRNFVSIVCSCCCSENCSFTWPGFASGAPATVPRGRRTKHYSNILRLRLLVIIGWIRKTAGLPSSCRRTVGARLCIWTRGRGFAEGAGNLGLGRGRMSRAMRQGAQAYRLRGPTPCALSLLKNL